jgi:hypothetical protein
MVLYNPNLGKVKSKNKKNNKKGKTNKPSPTKIPSLVRAKEINTPKAVIKQNLANTVSLLNLGDD